MQVKQLIVDNRVLMLGLDKLYRDAIKAHENLTCLTALVASLASLTWTRPMYPSKGIIQIAKRLRSIFD